MYLKRIILVTAGLSATGAAAGALIGSVLTPLSLLLMGMRQPLWEILDVAAFGGVVGACVGAVLAPAMAWMILRHVPIGRAIAETGVGTMIGGLVGAALGGPSISFLLGVSGFVVAALRLHSATPLERPHTRRELPGAH
jgi:hypothetical protein